MYNAFERVRMYILVHGFMLGWWNGRHWRLDVLSGAVVIQC